MVRKIHSWHHCRKICHSIPSIHPATASRSKNLTLNSIIPCTFACFYAAYTSLITRSVIEEAHNRLDNFVMEDLQKKLQTELDNLKTAQKEYHKALSQRQQLDGQLNENMVVKTELDLMKPDAEVYKLIGPVLVKQDLEEAKQNVAKRMDYISGELKRIDEMITALDSKQEAHREKLSKLQHQFLPEQAKAGVKA